MASPTPREIFDAPEKHLDLLTGTLDSTVERQHLDRKEAPRLESHGAVSKKQLSEFMDQVIEVVSGFANANSTGGLLVIGISKHGEVVGVDHLTEENRNRLTSLHLVLRNESCQCKTQALPATVGTRQVLFIFVPPARNGLCETADASRRAWVRHDLQNLPLTPERRQTLEREKGLIPFENSPCCAFDPQGVDPALLKQFRESHNPDGDSNHLDDTEFLRRVGAVERDHHDKRWFTTAGLLFFGKNPRSHFPRAYIRLMKFEGRSDEVDRSALPSFDKDFDGPLTEQVRKVRAFLRGSAFLKTYQRRAEHGGFKEEPELPFVAIDEAIVNAVAHRDYGAGACIEVRLYRDALVVTNAGRVIQSNQDLPDSFGLDATPLNHHARNSKILEWMRKMRDNDGRAFVQLLSEGTKTMTKEMIALGLPAPEFRLTPFDSTLVLHSRAEEREAVYRKESITTTEFANLYALRFDSPLKAHDEETRRELNRRINIALANRLRSAGWFVDSQRFGRTTVHQRGAEIRVPTDARRFVRIYPAYVLQLRAISERLHLCVDYDVQVKNPLRLTELTPHLSIGECRGRRALVRYAGRWEQAKLVECGASGSQAFLFDSKEEVTVPNQDVIPSLPTWRIAEILSDQGVKFDLHRTVKDTSLSLQRDAARLRAERTNSVVELLAGTVFPLRVDNLNIGLAKEPMLLPRSSDGQVGLTLQTLDEPPVRFDHDNESRDIRDGITKFGAYETSNRSIELVPVVTLQLKRQMETLIERIRAGSYKFKGTERTFKTRLTYNTVVTATEPRQIVEEVRRLLEQRPEWKGDGALRRLFLIYAPTRNFASDDENSPYFQCKRLLLEAGIPCQMVDQPTLVNPDWKDLNLALNIVAKCGVTPWVLPESIPDADFFVGLSYTQNGSRGQEKYLGYANVFNQFGKWEFYSGSGNTFPFADRSRYFAKLVQGTLERLAQQHALHPSPSIAFHYSAKFSRDDIAAILAGARAVRPDGRYTFVWINTHHIIRFYDQKPETDGSLRRGGFVVTSPSQLYVSTTGFNPYRKTLGTPLVLEANIHVEGPPGHKAVVDHKSIANQILCLTKLNWASTDSLCGEPITTKYAGDVAYLTAAFLRQTPSFQLHPILESTPWFI